MKKIFLIYPPSPVMNREDRCQQPVDDLIVIPPLPPTDLMYMASIARQNNALPKIKDYSLKSETIDDFILDFREFSPDMVVVNTTTPTLESDFEVLKKAKEIKPQVITIAKGAHFLTYSKEILEKYPFVDILIRGECELTFDELTKELPRSEIKGITYKNKKGLVIDNPCRELIQDLDILPFPARDLIDNDVYKRPDNNKLQAVIKVSRGCPYHCFFCLATPTNGAKVRTRSPENILKEIEQCYCTYGIKNFIFWSDIFNLDNGWVKKLCNKIINSGLKITFSTNTRADTADIETIKLMKKAGCSLVSLGVESGSQYMLDKMGKKITLKQVESTVKAFKKYHIKIYAYYVIGLPWETEETVKQTLDFAKKLNTDFVSFYTATALVGTKFYEYIQKHNLGDLNYDKPYFYPGVDTHFLSKEEVFLLHKKAFRQYYLRPKYILKMLISIRSFCEFKNYLKAGLKILKRGNQ